MILTLASWLFDDGEEGGVAEDLVLPSDRVWAGVRRNRTVCLHVHVAQEVRASFLYLGCACMCVCLCGGGMGGGERAAEVEPTFLGMGRSRWFGRSKGSVSVSHCYVAP